MQVIQQENKSEKVRRKKLHQEWVINNSKYNTNKHKGNKYVHKTTYYSRCKIILSVANTRMFICISTFRFCFTNIYKDNFYFINPKSTCFCLLLPACFVWRIAINLFVCVVLPSIDIKRNVFLCINMWYCLNIAVVHNEKL